ncbi:MAG: cob(I)yrinic acid a,c-diamide adenosyltransferase [Bacteroidales bacterium]|nr:cob(I)yrinic acid a,c-diamide adenosyltransferase [Bacteroidales bacterium]
MSTEFKIYTKTGDKGETSLIGGTRVPKFHERIEAYGTLDELNSFIGLIRDQDIDEHSKEMLIEIQDRIFTAESLLAQDTDRPPLRKLPQIIEDDVVKLELEIDKMNETLPPLSNFVLPGGHPVVSYCHIARTICRRAERFTLKLSQKYDVDELVIKYLNRLSDYLFVLSRKMTIDFNAIETPWKARV